MRRLAPSAAARHGGRRRPLDRRGGALAERRGRRPIGRRETGGSRGRKHPSPRGRCGV